MVGAGGSGLRAIAVAVVERGGGREGGVPARLA